MRLWVDTETYNDLDLREVGTSRYTRTCELLILTWALEDGQVQLWDRTDPTHNHMWEAWVQDCAQASVFIAANAPFDRGVLSTHQLAPSDPSMWDCVQARARKAGWARVDLDSLGKQLGLPEDSAKMKDGKRLVRLFTRPHKPTKREPVTRLTRDERPEEWQQFCEYAKQDVVALRAQWERLPGMNDSEFERRLWVLDQHINDQGWPIDLPTVRHACCVIDECILSINAQINELTHGEVQSVTSLPSMLKWIQAHGYDVENLTAETIGDICTDPKAPLPVRQLAALRREGARATNAKYYSLAAATDPDERLRTALVYGAASRTLRWAGRKFNPHNLIRPPKGYDARLIAGALAQGASAKWLQSSLPVPPLESMAFAIRGMIQAKPGKILHRGDLSQIEARLVNWHAGNDEMLRVFADPDQDPYVHTASNVGSTERQLGKVLTLACGYGMAGETFLEQANAPPYLLNLSLEEADYFVKAWRESNKPVVSFWYALNDACIKALLTRQPVECRRLLVYAFEYAGIVYLGIRLPSLRWLCLPKAFVDTSGRRPAVTFMGEKGWQRTHGGPLVGIVTQSTARDVLAHGMLLAADDGFNLVGHVHDEAISEDDEDSTYYTAERFKQHLTTLPWWCPDFPLAAETARTKRFAKL